MMRHVSCILLLEWSRTSQRLWVYRISVPYAQKDPRFLFKKRRGQPREFWSLVSTIDGSTLPQDCVEEQLCREAIRLRFFLGTLGIRTGYLSHIVRMTYQQSYSGFSVILTASIGSTLIIFPLKRLVCSG